MGAAARAVGAAGGRQRSRVIRQSRKVPDSAGAAAALGYSSTRVKPSLRGTPSLARLARSWWISTIGDPRKGEGGRGERRGGPGRVTPAGVRGVHPVPDLQPGGSDAAVEPEAAGDQRTEEEAVHEVPSRVPLPLPSRQGGTALLDGDPARPGHPWQQVLPALGDRLRLRLGVGGAPPPEDQPAAEVDALGRGHQLPPTKLRHGIDEALPLPDQEEEMAASEGDQLASPGSRGASPPPSRAGRRGRCGRAGRPWASPAGGAGVRRRTRPRPRAGGRTRTAAGVPAPEERHPGEDRVEVPPAPAPDHPGRGGDEDQPLDPLGVPQRQLHGDAASERDPQHAGSGHAHAVQDAQRVGGHDLDRIRPVRLVGAPRAAVVEGDDLTAGGELIDERRVLGDIGAQPEDEQERAAPAADLAVDADAVGVGGIGHAASAPYAEGWSTRSRSRTAAPEAGGELGRIREPGCPAASPGPRRRRPRPASRPSGPARRG